MVIIGYLKNTADITINLISRISEQTECELFCLDDDSFSEKLAQKRVNSQFFIVFFTNTFISSDWYKKYFNNAFLKFFDSQNINLIGVKIGKHSLPEKANDLIIHTFDNYNDSAINEIIDIVKKQNFAGKSPIKKRFVNRNLELGNIQELIFDDRIKIICLFGIYGIGKKALFKEAINQNWSNFTITEFNLSEVHIGSRLTIEFCKKSGLSIPTDGSNYDILKKINCQSIDKFYNDNNIIVFNQFEEVLNNDRKPNQEIIDILLHYCALPNASKTPIFITTRRWPEFDDINLYNSVKVVKIDSLKDIHLLNILQAELAYINPSKSYSQNELLQLAQALHGYPLAGRLASNLVVRYGPEYILNEYDKTIERKIKFDIAEKIIAKLPLNDIESIILEVHAIFDNPIDINLLAELLDIDFEIVNEYIDNLINFNLLETEGITFKLHPLIKEFFLKRIRIRNDFKTYAKKLSDICIKYLKKAQAGSSDYIYWLTNASHMLFLSGNLDEALKIRKDFVGEIRYAITKLYQRREYATALKYCDEYLITYPNDKNILFQKARTLSQLNRLDESLEILQDLIKNERNRIQLSKFYYAIGRAYMENTNKNENSFELAKANLIDSLKYNEHERALQAMGELLLKENELEEAAEYLEKSLQISSTNPYSLSFYADVLWNLKRKDEAMEILSFVLKLQPNNASFLHRFGKFLLYQNNKSEAYKYFSKAVQSDDNYIDARLSLADICLDVNLEETEKHIQILDSRVSNLREDKQLILESIKAGYNLKIGNLDEAEKLAKRVYNSRKNIQNIGLLSNVYFTKYKQYKKAGQNTLSELYFKYIEELLKEGQKIAPNDNIMKDLSEKIKNHNI